MGYLNAQPGDDQLVEAMGETGTDQVPAPNYFQGTGEAVGKGIAGGFAAVSNAMEDWTAGGLGKQYLEGLQPPVLQPLHPSQNVFPSLNQPAFNWQADVSAQRMKLDKWLHADDQYTGAGAQMIGGVAKGFTEFAVGAPAGPMGAAAAMGGAGADETYHDLTAQGVDDTTAKEGALASGLVNAAGAVVPFKLTGIAAKLLGSGAINAGLGFTGRASQAAVLQANGYPDLAHAQHVFDLQQAAVDFTLGTAMGFGAHAYEHVTGGAAPAAKVPPSVEDAARATADQMHAADSTIGIPTRPDLTALHEEVFGRGMDDLNNGREPKLSDAEAYALTDHILPNPDTMQQHVDSAAIYAQDPFVQLGAEMGPKLDEAQRAVDLSALDQFAPQKPIHEMSAEELDSFADTQESALRSMEDTILGPRAGEWRRANADKADDIEREMGLSEQEVAALYGTRGNTPLPDWMYEDLEPYKDAKNSALMVDTPAHAARSMAGFLVKLGRTEGEPASWSTEQKAAYLGMGVLRDRMTKLGLDSAEIQKNAIQVAAHKFGDANDAEFMLERFLKPRQKAKPATKLLAGNAETAAEETPTKPLTPENEALLRQLEAKHGAELIDMPDGERLTVAQVGQRLREEAARADSNDRLTDAAVACFARTGGAL